MFGLMDLKVNLPMLNNAYCDGSKLFDWRFKYLANVLKICPNLFSRKLCVYQAQNIPFLIPTQKECRLCKCTLESIIRDGLVRSVYKPLLLIY